MTESVRETRRIIGVCTPCGLGWRRVVEDTENVAVVAVPTNADVALFDRRLGRALRDGPRGVVVTDLHNADASLSDRIEEAVGEDLGGLDVWLAGAGDLPNPLQPLLSGTAVAVPLDQDDFAARWCFEPRFVLGAIEYSAGWPEACTLTDGRLAPSAELLRFVNDLRVTRPAAADFVLLAAATHGGLTVGELAGAAAAPGVLSEIRLVELFGALRRDGTRLVAASPVVADAVVRTEADRHRAALVLSRSPAARGSAHGALAMLRGGLRLEEAQRRILLTELRDLELHQELDRAEELVALLASSDETDLQVAARTAGGRMSIARGGSLPVEAGAAGPGDNRLVDAVARLEGLDATVAVRHGRTGPIEIFPGLALPPGLSSTTFDPLLLAVLGRPEEATVALGQLGDDVVEHAVRVVTLAFCARPHEALQVISESAEHTLAHARGLACLFRSVAGDYVRAGADFTALVGTDWSATSPLFRLLGLWIAGGLDVERARAMSAHVQIPPEDRMGNLAALLARGQVEHVAGNAEGSRSRFRRFWQRSVEAKLAGLLHVAAPYVLDVFFGTEDLDIVCATEPIGVLAPTVGFAVALRSCDVTLATSYIDSVTEWPYRRAQGRVLVGRLCMASGDTDDARRHFAHAAAVFETLGAPVAHANTLKLLRSSGLRNIPAPRPRLGDAETALPREAEILDCLAQGMTNKEIAAHLHIAYATVKRRVSAMLHKYDVTTRRDLAVVARRSS